MKRDRSKNRTDTADGTATPQEGGRREEDRKRIQPGEDRDYFIFASGPARERTRSLVLGK